jgi:hypothetical protein
MSTDLPARRNLFNKNTNENCRLIVRSNDKAPTLKRRGFEQQNRVKRIVCENYSRENWRKIKHVM